MTGTAMLRSVVAGASCFEITMTHPDGLRILYERADAGAVTFGTVFKNDGRNVFIEGNFLIYLILRRGWHRVKC